MVGFRRAFMQTAIDIGHEALYPTSLALVQYAATTGVRSSNRGERHDSVFHEQKRFMRVQEE